MTDLPPQERIDEARKLAWKEQTAMERGILKPNALAVWQAAKEFYEQAAEAERDRLEKQLRGAREWAASTENPAFDKGWHAGRKRANTDLKAERDRLAATAVAKLAHVTFMRCGLDDLSNDTPVVVVSQADYDRLAGRVAELEGLILKDAYMVLADLRHSKSRLQQATEALRESGWSAEAIAAYMGGPVPPEGSKAPAPLPEQSASLAGEDDTKGDT